MRSKRFFLLVAALMVSAVALAACGGGGSSSSSSESEPESGATAESEGSSEAGSGEPIKIMTVAIVGSPVADYPEVQEDAAAAVDAINKEGGVNGHEIEGLFCNTKGDANVALDCAREAVKEGVVAMVGGIDLYDSQTFPVFEAAGIPIVGEWSDGDPTDAESEYSFPMNSGSWGSYATTVYSMKSMGKKKLTVAPLDLPGAITQAELNEAAAEEAGLELTEQVKIPIEGVTDYTPYAQQISSNGAEGVVPLVGPAAFEGLVKANESIGIEPTLGVCIICGESAPGLLLGSPYPLATKIKPFNEQREAAGLGAVSPTDSNVYSGLNAWLAVHAFAEVAKQVKGEISNSTMKEALEAAKGINVEGITTYDPAELGSPELGAFPRFPKTKFYTFEIDSSGKFVETKLPPVEDPIKAGR
jgi:ABC-type branched-subunit amino acid transport system substrate-binding protein